MEDEPVFTESDCCLPPMQATWAFGGVLHRAADDSRDLTNGLLSKLTYYRFNQMGHITMSCSEAAFLAFSSQVQAPVVTDYFNGKDAEILLDAGWSKA